MFSLLTLVSTIVVNENLLICPLVPPEAGLGWKLELFEIAETITPHYHKIQRQYILVVEGEARVLCGNAKPLLLQSGQMALIDPGVVHSLVPEGRMRFLAIDLPGFDFPEDVFYDQPLEPIKWAPISTASLPQISDSYFGAKFDRPGYMVHELVNGRATGEKWSAAFLEIKGSQSHFHRIASEHFIVVHGTLDIEVDGVHHILGTGESILVAPEQVHQLTSVSETPVHVLCIDFPAFDPTDSYYID